MAVTFTQYPASGPVEKIVGIGDTSEGHLEALLEFNDGPCKNGPFSTKIEAHYDLTLQPIHVTLKRNYHGGKIPIRSEAARDIIYFECAVGARAGFGPDCQIIQ